MNQVFTLSEAINKIRLGVVQICIIAHATNKEEMDILNGPFISHILGSGFFITKKAHIITARHVILDGQKSLAQIPVSKKNMYIGIGLPNSERFIGNTVLEDFTLIDEDPDYDLALLQMTKNPFNQEISSGVTIKGTSIPVPASQLKLNPKRPIEGQRIGISGYPLQERVLITSSGHIASVWKTPYYLADIEVNPGNSGGPVYLVEDASVLGVCVSLKPSPIRRKDGKHLVINGEEAYASSGLTNVIPSKYVIDLIERNGISYT